MIIVTGLRSGTSLMMQTLKILGTPITGVDYHDEFSHKELNPKGYWNLTMSETVGGIQHNKYKGMAVKLGGADLYQTKENLIDRIIWCRRNKTDTIESIKKLLELNQHIVNLEPSYKNSEWAYETNKKFTLSAIEKFNKPVIIVWYEDVIERKCFDLICNFVKGNEKRLEKCKENIIREVIWQ